LGVLLVWGPLMVGGTSYAAAGSIAPRVFAACLPYALLVTTVLIGKHVDKFEQDQAKGIHTLPIVIGYQASLWLNQALMLAFYVVTIALVATHVVGFWVLLVIFSVPRLIRVLKIYARPKPTTPPANFRVWPLWYVAAAFYLNKLSGGLFILGLILNLLFHG